MVPWNVCLPSTVISSSLIATLFVAWRQVDTDICYCTLSGKRSPKIISMVTRTRWRLQDVYNNWHDIIRFYAICHGDDGSFCDYKNYWKNKNKNNKVAKRVDEWYYSGWYGWCAEGVDVVRSVGVSRWRW